MAAQSWVFNQFLEDQATGTNDFSSHSYYAALMGTGYSPDIDNDEEWDDVSANEVTVEDGYTAGGVELSGVTITRSDASNDTTVSWTAPIWTIPDTSDGLSGIKGMMLYNHDTGTLIAFFEQAAALDVPPENYFTVSPVPSVSFENGGV